MFLTFWGKAALGRIEHINMRSTTPMVDDHARRVSRTTTTRTRPKAEDAGARAAHDHHDARRTCAGRRWRITREPLPILSRDRRNRSARCWPASCSHGYPIEPSARRRVLEGHSRSTHLMHEMHGVPLPVKLSATIAMLLDLLTAWYAYIKNPSFPAKMRRTVRRALTSCCISGISTS
jgi:NADH-quinone oxidoreductase subunit L